MPNAASRAILVGLEAFDEFVEDNDIPLVGGGPRWPDPPKLDRDGKLVSFRNPPQPVKWGWAETWTSPRPHEWRTATDGVLDADPESISDQERDKKLAGFVKLDADTATPTTQSPLGRLRGRRQFEGDDGSPDPDASPNLDIPSRRDRPERGGSEPYLRGSAVGFGRPESPKARELADLAERQRPERGGSEGRSTVPRDVPGLSVPRSARGAYVDAPPHSSLSTAPPPVAPGPVSTAPTISPAPGRFPGSEVPTRRPHEPRDRESRGREPRARESRGREPRERRDRGEFAKTDRERSEQPSRARKWLVFVGLSILFALLLQNFVLQANSIPSTSMSPTLIIDDYVLVNKLSYSIGSPSRGNVIVFDRPESVPSEDDVFIKRVIGLPGETVTFVDGKVVIDGEPLDESYTASSDSSFPLVDQIPNCEPSGPQGGCLVPNDSVFVMGDNRRNSSDSRRFGPIKMNTIAGRAFMRIWPSSRIGGL